MECCFGESLVRNFNEVLRCQVRFVKDLSQFLQCGNKVISIRCGYCADMNSGFSATECMS